MLVVKAHIRFFMRRPLQLILTIFGIALGVAVVTAVDLANTSAQKAFKLSMTKVMGNTSHQIISNNVNGFAEKHYRDFRFKFAKYTEIKSAPIVEGVIQTNNQSFRLLGIDIFSERHFRQNIISIKDKVLNAMLSRPNGILMSENDADRLNLHTGSFLNIQAGNQTHKIEIVGLIGGSNPATAEGLLITDISSAQEILNRIGRIDRIDLILPADNPQTVVAVKAWLPQQVYLANALAQSNTRLQTTRAFQVNLQAMSLMAILVGGFLIFNTFTFSILQRRSLIGVLRGLGVTQSTIFTQIIVEAIILGLIGTIFGLLLGYALGTGLITLIARTINDLYFVVAISKISFSSYAFVKGASIGLTISVLAALSPAWEASSTSPVTAQHRSTLETAVLSSMSKLLILGFGIMTFSAIALILTENLVYAFSWLFLFVIGYCFVLAPIIVMIFKVCTPILRHADILVRLAVRSIPASLSRTSIAIAALTVAIAATIGVGVMVKSFRYSVDQWLQRSLSGDLYISPPKSSNRRIHGSIPASVNAKIKAIDGVVRTSHVRRVEIRSSFGPIELFAIKPPLELSNRPPLIQGDVSSVWLLFDRGKRILVSEPFARRNKIKKGNTVGLYTDKGIVKFIVGGIVQDYRSNRGIVFIHRKLYNRHWVDPDVSGIGIYLSNDANMDAVRKQAQRIIKEYPGAMLHSNKEILEESLEIFDRTFTIIDVLRLLAIGVAFCGVFSALLAFQLERIREIALLRATGLTAREVWILIGTHTGIIGLLSGLFAIPLGLILAWVLINVINQIAFGWSMDIIIPYRVIFEGVLLAIIASILAAIYPAWRMSTISPAQALREE